jgi:hypothetical protein
MSEQVSTSDPTQGVEQDIPLTEFLESVPPGRTRRVVTEVTVMSTGSTGRPNRARLKISEIQLHCPSDTCNGERFFRTEENYETLTVSRWNFLYLAYKCANCQKHIKTYSLAVMIDFNQENEPVAIHCYKFGELPPYGPPTPSRLISLMGTDRELFLKGRRSENQGLGIGAFVYYRRVVEDQKNRIIDEIIKVAEMIDAPSESITALKNAQKEHHFSKAVETIKDAIPQRLMIAGRNPFTLLHTALSRGVHAQTDEKCLELAADIRVILIELAELLGHALKDERELKEAVTRLVRHP